MPEIILPGEGVAQGSIAQRLLQSNMDPGALRPAICSKTGRHFITLNAGNKEQARNIPTTNALLQDNEWRLLDRAIMSAARPKLTLYNDLRQMAPVYNIPNGMNFSTLVHQRASTPGRAQLSMDGIIRGQQERRSMDLAGIPLPIISKQFSLTAREVAVSRQMGTDLDTAGAADAATSCAEEIERITAGTASSYAYGGYTQYGYTSFPNRLTGTMMIPTNVSWTPDQARNDFIAILQALANVNHTGPFRVYYSVPWMQYMMRRYSQYEGASLVDILKRIPGITDVKQADYLTSGYQIIVVEESQTVAQAVVGMELQTIQWEEMGGMEIVFMVMGILTLRLRADKLNQTGIAHYTGT